MPSSHAQFSIQIGIIKIENLYSIGRQAAIKAIYNYQINTKLAWDCHQSLAKPYENNRV
jgi:hypothetical protein